MAFLDNSGDIILDAVLTDTGRARLAKGDGSFKVVKFVLGDDEIDYALYNKTHASGSAYYDLEIMQTPILEAFTNNTSILKHRLISLPRTNLLYLPVILLNQTFEGTATSTVQAVAPAPTGVFLLCVDKDTEDAMFAGATFANNTAGLMKGERPASGGGYIRADQGLDTTEISPAFTLDADLVETQYILRVDNRFAQLCDKDGNLASVSFVDDDNIASYYLSLGTDTEYVHENSETDAATTQVIDGPRGTFIQLKLRASLELNTSVYLFDEIGGGTLMTIDANDYKFIDSTVRITGATTGYALDVPVRFAKKVP